MADFEGAKPSIITALWLAPLTLATAHIPVVRDLMLPL
jgi:hypothetical protein